MDRSCIKAGEKAFVVVPDGIMNRINDKKLKDFILEKCNIDAVISLPLNTTKNIYSHFNQKNNRKYLRC